MTVLDIRGQTVLVTGASSGLGRSIACVLARDYGAHVIAVARRETLLQSLEKEAGPWPGSILPTVLDVTDQNARADLIADLMDVKAAVLNAGMTFTGPFLGQHVPEIDAMLRLNMSATTALAHGLGPALQSRQGGLMFVASLGGLAPLPYQAAYGATKAYLVSLGLALNEEWRPSGASVTTFCPGGIATEMTAGAQFDGQRRFLSPADKVAQNAVAALCARRAISVPGAANKVMAAALKLLPRTLAASIVERQFRRDMTA